MKDDIALEDIGVLPVVSLRRIRRRNAQQIAQFAEKELIVGAFRRAGIFPTPDEFLNGG